MDDWSGLINYYTGLGTGAGSPYTLDWDSAVQGLSPGWQTHGIDPRLTGRRGGISLSDLFDILFGGGGGGHSGRGGRGNGGGGGISIGGDGVWDEGGGTDIGSVGGGGGAIADIINILLGGGRGGRGGGGGGVEAEAVTGAPQGAAVVVAGAVLGATY